MICILAYSMAVSPAAFAFFAGSNFNFYVNTVEFGSSDFNSGNKKCGNKGVFCGFCKIIPISATVKSYFCFKRFADKFLSTGFFKCLIDNITKFIDFFPFCHEFFICYDAALFGELVEENRTCVVFCASGKISPDFFSSKGKDRCKAKGHAAKNVVNNSLCSSSAFAVEFLNVKSVFKNI